MAVRRYLAIVGIAILYSCNTGSSGVPEKKVSGDPLVQKLKLPENFRAEHLYSPSENKHGSWVSMVFDDKGRMIVSDQYGALYRLRIPEITGDSGVAVSEIEKLRIGNNDSNKLGMGYAQGLVWAFNSLFVVVNHKGDSAFEKTSGFYRLQDTDGDDQFDKVTLLKTLIGEEEHGPHSVKLAPDGKSFYVIAGNHTKLPENIDHFYTPPVWERDNLLHPLDRKDPRTKKAAGWIAHVDSSGKKWDIVAAGFRNPFDLAFNEAGEMFTYDSDMEWDIGMAWYRPTRICHVPSGAEFGWRDGNAKWSPSYPDNLPPILNIGQGSPTNMISLSGARFPDKFRHSLLAFDWSFGIIYAVHLQPEGASYAARAEEFVSGAPLPLTDGVIGPDGALYFLTGGRRLESHLYRVYYEDGKGNAIKYSNVSATPELSIRKRLEELHRGKQPGAIDTAWSYLGHPDRFVRFAARIALEHQPSSQWRDRVFSETNDFVKTHALLALVRSNGAASVKNKIFNALTEIKWQSFPEARQIDYIRTVEVALSRLGKPDGAATSKLLTTLSPAFPAPSNDQSRSLGKILVFLGDETFARKALEVIDDVKDDTTEQRTVSSSSELILRNPQYGMDIAGVLSTTPPAQQIYYAILLSDLDRGWTPELREKYFSWLHKAYGYKGGRHYLEYLNAAKKLALSDVPRDRYKYYDSLSTNSKSEKEVIDWVKIMSDGGAGRRWTVQEALDTINDLGARNYEMAKNMFTAAACATCHSVRGEGGAIGPDLTQLGTRFSKKDILEAIIDPNKAISDQYASTVFVMKDGGSTIGKLVKEDDEHYYISQNPFAPENLKPINKKDVVNSKLADISLMPPGLINQLNPERLRDLMAYLISGGNQNHPVFSNENASTTSISK